MPSRMLRTAMRLVVHDKTGTVVWWASVGDKLRNTPHTAPHRTRRVLGGTPYALCRASRSSLP